MARISREIRMFSKSNARFLEKYRYFDGQGNEIIGKYALFRASYGLARQCWKMLEK